MAVPSVVKGGVAKKTKKNNKRHNGGAPNGNGYSNDWGTPRKVHRERVASGVCLYCGGDDHYWGPKCDFVNEGQKGLRCPVGVHNTPPAPLDLPSERKAKGKGKGKSNGKPTTQAN